MRLSLCLIALLGVIAGATPACAPTSTSATVAHPDASQVSQSTVRATKERPLVTEWPATERSHLESRTGTGLVAVEYRGQSMRVLDNCHAKGTYRFVPLRLRRMGSRSRAKTNCLPSFLWERPRCRPSSGARVNSPSATSSSGSTTRATWKQRRWNLWEIANA